MRVPALEGLVVTIALAGFAEEAARAASSGRAAPQAAAPTPEAAPPPAMPALPAACAKLRGVDPPAIAHTPFDPPVPELHDPELLAPFFEKVARLLRGEATDHVRIAVYGDSNATKDYLTGEMRRVLQGRYGDAGHGYIALSRPWSWYMHRDVRQGVDGGWLPEVVSSFPNLDGYYGHAMIAAESALRGAVTWVGTADDASPIGKTVSRVEIAYLEKPRFGSFDVKIDGRLVATVDSRARSVSVGYERLELRDAPHKIEMVARGGRPVRLLGATLERGGASFVVDNLSVGAASWHTLLRENPETMRATLRHRGYDLVIVHMGTNTWGYQLRVPIMRAFLARLHDALPGAPVVVMSPPDSVDEGELMERVSREQRGIAHDSRAAFFDFHAAMGGKGSMVRFFKMKMAQNDVIHFNEPGGAYMGDRVLFALWRELGRYLDTHPRAGCAPLDPEDGVSRQAAKTPRRDCVGQGC